MRQVLVVLWAIIAVGCAKPTTAEIPPPEVGVVTVLQAEIADEVRFSGRTAAPQRVEIQPQVEGTVYERFFADGQKVRRGDPLFQIDARSPEAALAQAQADLARAQVHAADTAKISATNESLFNQGVIGREEYQQSKADADASKALVRANQAIVKSAALTRGFATVVAPFDGRIGQAEVDVGSLANPGGPRLAVLARLDPMYLEFALSERQLLRLPSTKKLRDEILAAAEDKKDAPSAPEAEAPEPEAETPEPEAPEPEAEAPEPGAKLERASDPMQKINDKLLVALVLADGSLHPYQGVLNIVSIELDETTGTYPMRAIFPNTEELLIPNLFGEVIIRLRDKHEALMIPSESLVLKQVGTVVYVVGEGGTVEQRRVELGHTVGDLVEVTKGLEASEVIVSQGVHKCRDGLAVSARELDPLTLDSDPLAIEPAPGAEGWFERFVAERRTATLVAQ